MAAQSEFAETILFFKGRLQMAYDILPVPFNAQALGLAIITSLGVPSLITILLPPDKKIGKRYLEYEDSVTKEQSKPVFNTARTVVLVLGVAAGSVAGFISAWANPDRCIFFAWVERNS